MEATTLGDHRFDHLLDDLSTPARECWVQLARKTLADLPKQVDLARLSRPSQIDYEIFRHNLQRTLWLAKNTRPFEEDPRVYNTYISDSVFLLLTQSTLPKETNIVQCHRPHESDPQSGGCGQRQSPEPAPGCLGNRHSPESRSYLVLRTGSLHVRGGLPPARALRQAAAQVAACLRDYQRFLEQDLLPGARGNWRIGRRKFARKLELVLDAGMTADQVLADARTEFMRVEREMYVIARQLWSRYFPEASPAAG